MENIAVNSNHDMNLKELFDEKQKAIGEMAKEIAEREFELFELNLFVGSSGTKHLDMASSSVRSLRELERKGKINLSSFDKIAESF